MLFSAIDLNKDGHTDVLATSTTMVFWYENDGKQNFKRYTLDTAIDYPVGIESVDLNKDSYMDIVVVASPGFERNDKKKLIVWYENDGKENFTKHTIDVGTDAATSMSLVDLDKNGEIDILASSFYQSAVFWYENKNGKFSKK